MPNKESIYSIIWDSNCNIVKQIQYAIPFLVAILLIPGGMAFAQIIPGEKDIIKSMDSVANVDTSLENKMYLGNPDCRDTLVYVERPSGKFACVKESTAEKLGWNIIATNQFAVGEAFMKGLPLDEKISMRDDGKNNPSTTLTIKSESTNGGHSFGNMYPRPTSVTLELPSHVDVGQVFSIDYELTFDFDKYGYDDFSELLNATSIYPLLVLVPDEFSPVTEPDWRHLERVDKYEKHGMYRTAFVLDDVEDLSGSIEFRLDKQMVHDYDEMILNAGVRAVTYIGIDKTTTGVNITHIDHTILLDGTFPESRYAVIWDGPLSEYVPTERYAQSVSGTSDDLLDYLPNIGDNWEKFAEFLRMMQETRNISDMARWLTTGDNYLSEEFVNDFFEVYPEFRTQTSHDAVSGAATPSPHIFVSGTINIQQRDNSIGPASYTKVCLYDKDVSTTSDFEFLYFDTAETNPACVITGENDDFSIYYDYRS